MSSSLPSNAQPMNPRLERRRHRRPQGSGESSNIITQSIIADPNKSTSMANYQMPGSTLRRMNDEILPSTIKTRYTCVYCRMVLDSQRLWMRHINIHSAALKCPIKYCDKYSHLFHDRVELDRHMMDDHKSNGQHWYCCMCKFQTESFRAYSNHQEQHPLATGFDQILWWDESGRLFELDFNYDPVPHFKRLLWIHYTHANLFRHSSAITQSLLKDNDERQDRVSRNDAYHHPVSHNASSNLKRKTKYTISEDLSGDAGLQKRLCILKERSNPLEMARALRQKRLV